MTKREQEILGYIRENPFISQAEIAEKANITRSSVAVHITNLVKKGLLKGRAYVLADNMYIVAIGGVTVNIEGRSQSELISNDVNTGLVIQTVGGSCKNIVDYLNKFEIDVELITAFSDDFYGNTIIDACKTLRIPIKSSLFVPGTQSSTCISVYDDSQENRFEVSDMNILDNISPDFIASRSDVISGASALVIDANLREDTIDYIASNFEIPIFVDPVSISKSHKLVSSMGRFFAVKATKREAEILTEIEIKKYKDLKSAAYNLIERGVDQVYISLGSGGVFYANQASCGRVPSIAERTDNDSGAEDAFMAGIVYSYLNRFNIKQSAQIGVAAAKLKASEYDSRSPGSLAGIPGDGRKPRDPAEISSDALNRIVFEAF
ncbi:MAG: PfkB family carbohydrate kinase [Oscillospiraceae bacterium]|jgi:pseudouridine kinase|nr:PfkB family carbohydrate kinase [Oscillospiraceae bacterium]